MAPKYGNDDDYVDSITVEAYRAYIDEITQYRNTRFGRGPIGGGLLPRHLEHLLERPLGSCRQGHP